MSECTQNLREGGTCPNPAAYRYVWPGSDESLICEKHSKHLVSVASAMGFALLLIPVDKEG